jgi:hypothetical protein
MPPPQSAISGCLLDVSGSMREALEAGRADENATERLLAVFRAALKIARAENKTAPDCKIFVGIFGLNHTKRCPTVVDLCGAVDALLEIRHDKRSGHDLLIELANGKDRAYIAKYIRENLSNDQANVVYKYLHQYPSRISEFVNAIPKEEEARKARDGVKSSIWKGKLLLTGLATVVQWAHKRNAKSPLPDI